MDGIDFTHARNEILFMLIKVAIATVGTYFTVKHFASALDSMDDHKKEAKKKGNEILKKMGIKEKLNLSEHELMIATQLVMSGQLKTTWEDIAGIPSIIQGIRETLILPIQQRSKITSSRLIQPPKGILLHGPPGCGKTLLARAVAHEAGARFINLDVASLTDKWYGESQKLSSAVFSLAAKIQPCIIFIDEIDSFLRVRNSLDHEATAMMKAQFLQQWDGLATDHSHFIVVMGATNRPQDVDRAILRRMPSAFHIPLPNVTQREEILKLILKDETLSNEVNIPHIALQTESFSGSDLQELCRTAAVYRLKHLLPLKPYSKDEDTDSEEEELRPITREDFAVSLSKMRESRVLDRSVNALLKMDID